MLTVGPVVGLVTNFRARVLVEAAQDSEWSCSVGDVNVHFQLKAGNPRVLEFDHLQPGTEYILVFQPIVSESSVVKSQYRARFRTRKQRLIYRGIGFNLEEEGEVNSDLGFSLLSCNHFEFEPKVDIWGKACDSAQNLRLHCGDQIYGDAAFQWGQDLLQNKSESDWPAFATEIEDQYRDIYRKTWGQAWTREFLACGSNLMIADDHEFTDDFDQRVPNPVSRFIGECAYRVFDQYQRSLRLNREQRQHPEDFFVLVLGSVGLIVLDSFASRFHTGVDAYLGSEQLEWIGQQVATVEVDRWLVLSSQPIFQHAGWVGQIGKIIPAVNDLQRRFNSSRYGSELQEFLSIFPEPPLFLAGDTHVGVLFRVQSPDGKKTHQIISSGIQNRLSWPAYLGFRALVGISSWDRPGKWRYTHVWSVPECNFANVQIGAYVQVTWISETRVWSRVL